MQPLLGSDAESSAKSLRPGGSNPGATTAAQLRLTAMREDYNLHSKSQLKSLQLFKPLLDFAVAALSSDLSGDDGAFVVADFGCSTGLNSSDAVSHVIGEVRRKFGWERCSSMLVVLNDLPSNHWGELFAFLHGDERSFLRQHRGVSAVASGLSFYQQVMPDNSLQLGISSVSLHWCSQLPVKMSDHCFSMLATDEERELFRQQAARDWNDFLTARSKELVRGGVLALNIVAYEIESSAIFDEIYISAKALLARGVISQEELLDFNFRMCFRSLEDVSDKSQYESLGLELLRAEKFPLARSAYYDDFLQHGDANRFALEFSHARSVVCEASFHSALSQHRTDEERQLICSQLWQEYRERIVRNPESFELSWNTIAVVIRKRSSN